jgi:hypothetical protein
MTGMIELDPRHAATAAAVRGDLLAAFPGARTSTPDRAARLRLMQRLHEYYSAYMAGPQSFADMPMLNADPLLTQIETEWLNWEDAQVSSAALPASADEFANWFKHLARRHLQPDFCDFIRDEATVEQIALFFLAEELVDGRFDDLVALVQIGADDTSKLTMAENYWDEMGEGTLDGMHTRLFEHSAVYMRDKLANRDVDMTSLAGTEIYENACLVLMYAIHRRLAPRALAAMGLMEYTAPTRFEAMVAGCTRCGVPADVIDYQRIHIHVDADHGAEWLENVLVPLVHRSPAVLREVALGLLTRERIATAYYAHVWQQMRAVR